MNVARTLAVGGTRQVPVPDPVAADYLLLALRLDQHIPGLVDAYYGLADLKARADMEQLRPPARLADDAAALRARLDAAVADPARSHWLDLQLVALETLARVQAGDQIPYLDQVTRCFAFTPTRREQPLFDAAAAELDRLLPGHGTLADRLAVEDDRWTIPPERVEAVVNVLVARFRARAEPLFGMPEGSDLRVSLVRNRPWTGYNWYDGGYRSRVDINLDLPLRLPAFVGVVAHETYPGHHLEHALKEQMLVEERGHAEASVLLINAPECLISEGLANVGRELVAPDEELADLLEELAPVAGLALANDPAALRETAARAAVIRTQRTILDESRINAALMRHVDGVPQVDVVDYLVDTGRFTRDTAAKRMEFIEHPLWRLYVFVYPEGEALLRRWLHAVPVADRAPRFGRLLREPLTPPSILAELASGIDAQGAADAAEAR